MGDSEVCKLTPLLPLTPFTCCLLFICQSFKGIKDKKEKTGIPLDWDFILEFTTILWYEWFSEPVEIVVFHPVKALKYIIELSSAITSSCFCHGYVAISWRRMALLNSGLSRHVLFLLAAKRKKVLLVEVSRGH